MGALVASVKKPFLIKSWFIACREPQVQTKVKDPKASLPVLLVVAGAVTALLWWRKRGASNSKGGKGDSSTNRSPFAFPGKKVRGRVHHEIVQSYHNTFNV